jgi:hypothetical protein
MADQTDVIIAIITSVVSLVTAAITAIFVSYSVCLDFILKKS